MPTLATPSGAISYGFNGTPHGADDPVLLLLHGAGGQRADWPMAWRNGSVGLKDWPVYCLDLPGHGRSDGPGCQTVEAYADAVLSFIEAKGLGRVILVGHSMGAAIALSLGSRSLPMVAGLVLIAGSPNFFVHERVLSGFQTHFAKTVDAIVGFSWPKEARESYKRLQRWHMLIAGSGIVYGDFLACSIFDIRDKLADIACPVQVIAARQDVMVPFKTSMAMVDALPDARFAEIRNSGHFPHVEKQAKCALVIEAFATEIA